jgi:hypothetical protein
MTAKNRTCKICKEYKDISNFQPSGYQCNSCRAEKQRAYWASLPIEIRRKRQMGLEAQKRYRENNLEKTKKIAREGHIRRKFGLTVEEYNAISFSQNEVCAICQQKCDTGYNLAVDHNHKTGKIRGLLCKNCNTSIGLLKEDIKVLENAIIYLSFHEMIEESEKEISL